MIFVVVFLAGGLAAAGALVIGFFGYVARVSTRFKHTKEELDGWNGRLQSYASDLDQRAASLAQQAAEIEGKSRQLDVVAADAKARKVQYDALPHENDGLKQDLFNLSVQVKKTDRDHSAIIQGQEELTARANQLAERFLRDNVSWIADRIGPNNYAVCKKRLLNVIAACGGIGFQVSQETEQSLLGDLKSEFEKAVRDEFRRGASPRQGPSQGGGEATETLTSKSRRQSARRQRFKRHWTRHSRPRKTSTRRRWSY